MKEPLLLHPAYFYKFTEKVGTWNNKVRNRSSGAANGGEKTLGPFNFLGYSYCRIIEFVRILCVLSWDWVDTQTGSQSWG
jgi:hypothetical protein